MTSTQAAYNAGVRMALALATQIADGIEARHPSVLRELSAVAALRNFAMDGQAFLMGQPPDPIREACRMIADDPADSGTIECPACAGCLRWLRDATNGHLHGQCETAGCLRWMQ